MTGGIDRKKGAGLRIPEEKRVCHAVWIEPGADQVLLFLLEGFGVVQCRANADENRAGIGRQPAREMIPEYPEVKAIVDHDRRHSGAAIGARDGDAVGGGVDDAGAIGDRLVHFGSRDVLPLPAEGVADPVDEMEEAGIVERHQVAGAKPGIAPGEHIAQDFLFGLGSVGIALEAASPGIGASDPPDGFADLAAGAWDTKTVRGTNRHAKLRIDANDRRRKAMRQQRWNSADRARPAFDIVEREIAFGRRVKFEELRNRKPCLKGFPDIAAQAVAAGEPKPVPGLEFGYGRLQKIPAKL